MAAISTTVIEKLPKNLPESLLMDSLSRIEEDLRQAYGVGQISGGFASVVANEYKGRYFTILAQVGVVSDVTNYFHTLVYKVGLKGFGKSALGLNEIQGCQINHTYSKDGILYPFFWVWPHDKSKQEFHITGFWSCAKCNRTHRNADKVCAGCGGDQEDSPNAFVEDVLTLSNLTNLEKQAIYWALEESLDQEFQSKKPIYAQFADKVLADHKPTDTNQAVLALRMTMTIDIMTVYARAINPNRTTHYDEAYDLATMLIAKVVKELSVAEFSELKAMPQP